VIEVPRKKKEAPAVQEVNPVKALVGHRIRTHYNTGGVVARVDYWGDADSYTIYYEDENAHKRLWLNDIKLQDGVILCEGKPLAIDEEEQAAQEVSMEAALDQIANGPGPTPEETAASKTKFQQDLARHRKVKEAPAADPVQALIGRRINHHGAVGAVNDVAGPRTDGLYVIYFQPDTGKSVLEYLMCALQDGVFTCDGVPLAFETDVPAQEADPIDVAETPEELMAAAGAVLFWPKSCGVCPKCTLEYCDPDCPLAKKCEECKEEQCFESCPAFARQDNLVQEDTVTDSPEIVTETAQSVTIWPANCKDCTLDVSCGKCPNCPEQYEEAEPVQEAPAVIPGTEVPIAAVYPNPDNPRKRFDEAEMEKLIASVKQLGVLAPILCVPDGDRYRIVDGERRYRAALAAELERVPLIVRDLTPEVEFEAMLTANIQRADLDPIEEATAFKVAVDRGWKQEQLAVKLGISQAQVANRLRLLKLPESIQENISREIMNPSQALMLVKVAHKPEMIKELAKKLDGVPVAASEEIIDSYIRNQCYSTPLCPSVSWREPKFDPDKEGCVKCPERVLAKIKGEKQHPFCMDKECWEKKQSDAGAAEMREKVTAALGEDAPAEILKLCNLTNYASLGGKIKPEDCEPCEHITPAINYANQVVTICRNPECFQGKLAKVQEAEKAERQAEKQSWEDRIQELTTLADEPASLLFMAAKAYALAEESFYSSEKSIIERLCEYFHWELPAEADGDEEDKEMSWLVERFKKLPEDRLLAAIYVIMLGAAGRDDEAYTLTLGAVAGEEAEA
jgi:ParB family chromosome partitioning protein